MKKIQFDMNLYKSVRQLLTKERLYGFVNCLCDFICYRCLYIYIYVHNVHACLSAPPPLQLLVTVVPLPSFMIICWQSWRVLLSPSFSRVRAASASMPTLWPGAERKDGGRQRHASITASACSRWPGRISHSSAHTQHTKTKTVSYCGISGDLFDVVNQQQPNRV